MLVASSGPLFVTEIVNVTTSVSAGVAFPLDNIFTVCKSVTPTAVPPLLPSVPSSVSLAGLPSFSSALTEAVLLNAPGPSMVAVTVIVTSLAGLPAAMLGMVQGKPVQPPPLTLVIVRLLGVSATTTLFAVSGPSLDTTKV